MALVSVDDRFLREGRYIIHGPPLPGTGSRPHRTADGAPGWKNSRFERYL